MLAGAVGVAAEPAPPNTARLGLAAFIRVKLKPNPTPRELAVITHVRECVLLEQCKQQYCKGLKPKLKHFDSCAIPTCMTCASARLTHLTCLGLISQTLIERFFLAQAELIKSTVVTSSVSAEQQQMNYSAKRAEFSLVMMDIYDIWHTRGDEQQQQGGNSKGGFIDHMLKSIPQIKPLLHQWETMQEAKRLRQTSSNSGSSSSEAEDNKAQEGFIH